MTETTEVLHHVPGRLRLRIPAAKGDRERLRSIQEIVAGLSGVRRVDANPMLGTVVVQYDAALFPDFLQTLAEYATQQDLFTIACDETCTSETERSVNRVIGGLNRVVHEATGRTINLKELLPLAIGAYGLLFVNRTAAAAQWVSWLQFAFDTYIDLHEDKPVLEVGQKVDSLRAQQGDATETLRAELAAIRAELHSLAERLPAKTPSSSR